MDDLLTFLGQPTILWTLFVSSIVLVLLDYLLPVDWLAYVGYVCFALFVGATIPAGPTVSVTMMCIVGVAMLAAHNLVFSRFLTNAPRYECCRGREEHAA